MVVSVKRARERNKYGSMLMASGKPPLKSQDKKVVMNMLVISALERLKQEDQELAASLGYTGTFFFFFFYSGFLPRTTAENYPFRLSVTILYCASV